MDLFIFREYLRNYVAYEKMFYAKVLFLIKDNSYLINLFTGCMKSQNLLIFHKINISERKVVEF